MKKLNDKEKAVFDYVCKISEKQGYAPSVRDICAALHYKSTSTVQMYLDRLLEYGYLCREAGKKRSLRPAAGTVPSCGRRAIPILRRTEQGELTETCFEGQLPFDRGEGWEVPALFAFPMSEESPFAEGGECFGVVDPDETPQGGELGVFSQPDGSFLVTSGDSRSKECLLGKLIAMIHILN